MKNESGYVSINVLILIMIVIILTISHLDSLVINRDLSKSRLDRIKSYNSSESKILQIIEEDRYRDNLLIKYILKALREKKYDLLKIKLDDSDLINQEDNIIKNDNSNFNNIVEISFDNHLNWKSRPNIFHIKSSSKIGRSKNNLIGDIIIANDIFTIEESIIYPGENEDLNKNIQAFFENFNSENKSLFIQYENFVNIYEKDSCILDIYKNEEKEIVLVKDMDRYINLESEYIKLFVMDRETDLNIRKYQDVESIINLSGIIYVEGNLYISTNFNFEGIIIVKNGKIIVEKGSFFKNRGLIISNTNKVLNSMSNVDIKYDADIIFEMGPFLPGYIDFKIKNIREE